MTVILEIYEKILNRFQSVQIFSADQLEPLLKRLDGKNITGLYANFNDERALTIGGGPIRFLVFISVNIDEMFFELQNPVGLKNKNHQFVVGGQLCEFKDEALVEFETCLQALNHSFLSGDASPELLWLKH